MALGPMLAWKRADLAGALQRLWWVGALAVASAFLTLLVAGYHVWPALGFAAAAWLIFGAAADILDRIAAFRRPSQAWNRARGLPRAAWGGAIAHAGVGVMFAGLAGMGLATDALVALKPGEATRLAGYEWRLERIRDVQGPNWSARRATVTVAWGDVTRPALEPRPGPIVPLRTRFDPAASSLALPWLRAESYGSSSSSLRKARSASLTQSVIACRWSAPLAPPLPLRLAPSTKMSHGRRPRCRAPEAQPATVPGSCPGGSQAL